jgi:ribosomal protein L29
MGKPKGTKDGQHLLVQVSATDSDAQQEFALPPRRMPRVRQKKSNGHRSNTCGHDFACFILVMILLIMMAAIGFLGFEYYKLSGQVEELTNAQKNWSPNGEMGIMVKEAAVKSDVDKQMEENMKNTIVLNTTIYAWYKQFLKLNLSVSRLIDDAKKWQAVLETTNQLGDLKGDVGSLKEKVTKLSSNGQEMDNDQRVMHNEIEQLKIDDEANKKVVTSLNSELPQFKDSLQTVVSRLGNLEHSHSEMKLETAGLALVNVTQMDADMQAMQSRMLRMSTVIKLLGATANSGGNGSANLTLVIQKLEDMKQAELEKAAVIESLKRRIGGVEQLEADHKDEHDMLITVITGFNSSLSDVKYDQQRTGALMEQHISNVTANIEAQLEKMTSSMGGLLEKTIVSPESFNVSSIINEVLNQVLLSAQVPMAEEIQLFSQEVEIIRNTLELQNMTIAELQQKLQQVQRSLWQLKAEVTSEKAANKHGMEKTCKH